MTGKLTARSAATTKPGRYGDGDGLWLVVAASGARKWVFRFSFAGRVTEMGLGSADTVGLAQARNRALDARKWLVEGNNPIEVRRKAKRAVPASRPLIQSGCAYCREEIRVAKRKASSAMADDA